MANVTVSSFASWLQADGRSQVRETHLDVSGVLRVIDYLAGAGADLNAALAAHAVDLGQSLQDAEITANVSGVTTLGSLFTPTFVFSTQSQNLAALRAAYKVATQTEAVMIGDFLSGLTNNQLANIFNMTAGQVTTLRANFLTPAATTAASIRAAAGT